MCFPSCIDPLKRLSHTGHGLRYGPGLTIARKQRFINERLPLRGSGTAVLPCRHL